MNIRAGQEIQHHLWPECYKANCDVTNLWRLRLDSSWRMLYTARGDHVRIVAFVIDVVDHRRYDRMFGYQ